MEPLRQLLGSKENLDWLKTDLNAAEIRTVQDYIRTKININVQAKSQAGYIWNCATGTLTSWKGC